MTYPLTAAQIRAKRRARLVDRLRSELNRLTWERSEIKDEYTEATRIYAAKLEKIHAKAARNAAAMAELEAEVQAHTDGGQTTRSQGE